ncbi:glycoside hydrolase family 128 protein [Hebeloma cylindrosporum]|uniref:Glycoside hydrolase family 128 protein n=1 Tax=Hebeloma cylindrosporum TaxID=76867 RepID=A0A0C2XRV7_HEBCY|nr:glycoside hydrolase family 128 protein [Hebeloma cylindrosporum h7]
MANLRLSLIFCAIVFAAGVDAGHIKRHRFSTHRGPCLHHTASTRHVTTSVAVTTTHTSSTHTSSTHTSSTHTSSTHTSSTHTSSTHAPTTTASIINIVVPSATKLTTQAAKPLITSLVPNNIKAGIAGGDAFPYLKDHIGWWYDWSPNPSKPGKPIPVPMLWGNGTVDNQDAQRLKAFENLATVPAYVLGYEEPDCPSGEGSAGMSVEDGVAKWESLIAPLRSKGTKLGSPSMCKQIDETWLAEFQDRISTPWDFTAIHINKNSLDGVKEDIDHYLKYGKPIWVTEFACVDGRWPVLQVNFDGAILTRSISSYLKDFEKFVPCTNQQTINNFINEIVPYLEEHPNVYAYAYSNGLGLGDVWPLMNGNSLSESGQTYLAAISKYH